MEVRLVSQITDEQQAGRRTLYHVESAGRGFKAVDAIGQAPHVCVGHRGPDRVCVLLGDRADDANLAPCAQLVIARAGALPDQIGAFSWCPALRRTLLEQGGLDVVFNEQHCGSKSLGYQSEQVMAFYVHDHRLLKVVGQVIARGGRGVPSRQRSSLVITVGVGSEDPGAHVMASRFPGMPTVELGNLGYGDDFDIEARGKPLKELALAQASSATGWPR